MNSLTLLTKYFLLLSVIYIGNVIGAPKKRFCAKFYDGRNGGTAPYDSYDSEQDYQDDQSDVKSIPDPTTTSLILSLENDKDNIEICQAEYDYCFALWKTVENGTQIMQQGCWKLPEKSGSCEEERCISTMLTSTSNMHFCCCSGDFCNRNMTIMEPVETAESVMSSGTERPELANLPTFWMSPVFFLCISLTCTLLMAIILFLGCKRPIKHGPETAPLAPSGPGYSSNLQNVDNLKLCSMLGQGKYGTVWKGMINEQAVAVKIFPAQHKQYFINERNIYSIPLMDCPSLLSYFGCDERRTLDDNIQYFLVLSLAPLGCLQDWLVENTTSYSVFCKMAKSITRGLSHLHTEIRKNDEIKPCICHRDLNTRNILVNTDLSCSISDFGFALKAFGSRYEYKGEMAVAETKSINEVGTLRYMAPEILEGAVNLRDCETALKQIDVYSLGLVLWELCVRCQDLYPQGQSAPIYKAPYEAEVGRNPTFEQMQVLVSRHKARPLFPPGWGGGPSGKIARDTCEDCWDHDAEARLTALCAEERIHELSNLRPRSHISRGPSPPLSANNLTAITPTRVRSFSVNLSSSGGSATIAIAVPTATTTTATVTTETANVVTPPNQTITTATVTGAETRRNYVNDNSSILVNLSSPVTEKNHIIYSQQIQPFQGRNPCQERNLAPANRQNQVLVERSKKHSFLERGQENSLSCLEDDVSVEDLISNSSRRPIEDGVMGEGFPKQNNTDKKLRGWHGVRALIQKKLFRKNSSYQFNAANYDEKSNLVDNKMTILIQTPSPTKDTTVNLIDNNNKYQNGTIQTKIERYSNRRPSNLDVKPITVRVNGLSSENKSNLIRNVSDDFCCTFKGMPSATVSATTTDVVAAAAAATANTNSESRQEQKSPREWPRIVGSKSANAVKNLHTSSEDKLITRQRSLEVFREVFSAKGSNERLRDPSQRVKTPGDVPPSVRKVRASKTLSLYDDRMMDSSGLNAL